MLDVEPKSYKFKHAQRMSLDGYKGVANDLMELNDPVADGFMRVSDMRNDVVIIQKLQDRVRDYDEVGFVRVAKFLKMPRLDFWHTDGLIETRREDGVWLVAVNDQELADKVARSNDGKKKFDDLFVEAFRGEISRGLANCLKREKLLNGGKYNLGFFMSYQALMVYDLFTIPTIAVAKIASGDGVLDTTLRVSEIYVAFNAAYNVINLAGAGLRFARDAMMRKMDMPEIPGHEYPLPRFDEPFIKHSLPEIIAPTIPLDRLIRGSLYLHRHGNKIITANSGFTK